jgi:exopolysaccharide biosynthesis protein
VKLTSLKKKKKLIIVGAVLVVVISSALIFSTLSRNRSQVSMLQVVSMELGKERDELKIKLAENLMKLSELESQDQYKINIELKQKINSIEKAYTKAVTVYEELLKLKESSNSTAALDSEFTAAIVLLANQNYEDATKNLNNLSSNIADAQAKVVASFTIPTSVPVNNSPPGGGYSRQSVNTDIGQYMVSIVAADLGSTRIIVDTASTSTCANDCPVLPLSEYVSRNGAFAGINGSYFCPAEYPSCAGKTNSFDTLLMNKDKVYFNSDNNIYSVVPVVVFAPGSINFVGQSSQVGRDTGIDGMIANQPLLIQGANIAFGGDGDPKKGSKSGRSFVANRGNTVYIGVVHNATVAESAIVLKAMSMDNALNLDSGGSTALWSGGYKVGPGRNLPNVILFTRR